MKKIPIILDCDPGHDDAMALVLAQGSEKIDLRLVTTVSGNNSLTKVTNNCLNILNYVGGTDAKVAQGYEYGMVRSYGNEELKLVELTKLMSNPDAVHGETGLDGFDFPEHSMKVVEERAVEAMAKTLYESEEPITIVAVGPLTNVAMLIRTFPNLKHKIEKISIMGGTCHFILTRPFMEFNTFMDPEATKVVFESGIPIDMYGYDVTYRVLYDSKVLHEIKNIGNKTSDMVYKLLSQFRTNHNSVFKQIDLGDTSPIHDACAIAGVIDPSLVTESKLMHVDVETKANYMDGATLCDYDDILGLPKNVRVIFDMDKARFFDLFKEVIKNCN